MTTKHLKFVKNIQIYLKLKYVMIVKNVFDLLSKYLSIYTYNFLSYVICYI